MTLLGRLAKRSLENPSIPISSVIAEGLWGSSLPSGVVVSEDKALGIIAYYRAISLLSGTLGSLPVKVFRNGTRELVSQRTIVDNPNPLQTPFEVWQTTFAHALSWGTAYQRKLRDGSSTVRQVWPIHPRRVKVNLVEGDDGSADKVFEITDSKGRIHPYTRYEIAEYPYLSIDGKAGISPMKLCRQSLGLAIAQEQYAASFFGSGTHLAGILTTDQELSPDEADRLKQRWREKVTGLDNAHGIAVLDKGATFKETSIPPEDAELLASREFSVTEIARLFGIPPHLLGAVDKTTSWGTGIESQFMAWVVTNLRNWIVLFEQRITRELLPGGWDSGSWYAEYDLEGLLRGDSAARAAFYASSIQWGWRSRNEVRVKENLEPVDGLDEFIVPSNMTLVTINGQPVEVVPAPAPTDDPGVEGGS